MPKWLFGFRWVNKPSWAIMCTIHFFNYFLPPQLWRNVSTSSLTHFERFKQPQVHFLVVYILFLEHGWKGGRLSEREVTKTQPIQSPACLPYHKNWWFSKFQPHLNTNVFFCSLFYNLTYVWPNLHEPVANEALIGAYTNSGVLVLGLFLK